VPTLVLPVHYVIYLLEHEGLISINTDGIIEVSANYSSYATNVDANKFESPFGNTRTVSQELQLQAKILQRCLEWTLSRKMKNSLPATLDGLCNCLFELCCPKVSVDPKMIVQNLTFKNVLNVAELGTVEYNIK